jgi:REP element-mobilizing transposase RayT
MPNHVHGIVVIREPAVGAKHFSPLHIDDVAPKLRSPSKTVGSIVRGFKIGVTKWFRKNGRTDKIWQRNYYEHIIRNQESLNRIRRYIQENPLRWQFDRENPVATKSESQNAWLT